MASRPSIRPFGVLEIVDGAWNSVPLRSPAGLQLGGVTMIEDGSGAENGVPDVVHGDAETGRLRGLYAEMAQLAGGLAHEIRNPLSTMSLNLELMAEDFQDPQTTRDRRTLQKIERLRRESQRLQDILENFLRFARVQELRLESSDLNTLVEEVRDFCEPQAIAQGIVVRTQYAADLPRLNLDEGLFRQALLNLFINARLAMPDGGELLLRTQREGTGVRLDVTDTGVGMTEDVRSHVFDAFYSTRAGGSGLGLPTTRKIVEAHDGTVRIQSEPGKGSQFTITLPGPSASRPNPPTAVLDFASAGSASHE